jgi:anti-sigma factor RsiW
MANHLSYEMLTRLIENRASAAEEAMAARHLAACSRCRSEREWLERISRPRGPRTPDDRAGSNGQEVSQGAWLH